MNSRRITKIVLIFSIGLVLIFLMYFAFLLTAVSQGGQSSQGAFLIARGASFTDIAKTLQKESFIRSASAFKILGILTGKAHQLKPGVYEINNASTTVEILSVLVAGPEFDVEVVIFEGENMYEIDSKLAERGIIKRGALENFDPGVLVQHYPYLDQVLTLEGFLFPDTYRFSFDSDIEEVVRTFLDNFSKKAWPVLSKGAKDFYETLIIASILEKEVPEFEDRRLVTGIIYSRLEIPMRLQIDATGNYEKFAGRGYDTYKNDGLPPGPISNPGLSAIEASTRPKTSPYLYYLSKPDGETLFSKTFEEHDEKRAKYLR